MERRFDQAERLARAAAAMGPPFTTTYGTGTCSGLNLLTEQMGNGPITARAFRLSDGVMIAIYTSMADGTQASCVAGPALFNRPVCPQPFSAND
jgi:hypothetical protein